ncbi:hypothetical protein ACNS7O_13570 [Haloferacaceae archaeon DSL9]
MGADDAADPSRIRSIAVTVDDLVTAFEANERANRGAVLRITTPFAGRMRARLHVAGGEGAYGNDAPIHLDPARLIADPPPYPDVDETAATLDDGEYDVDRHREKHARAVADWREAIRDCLVDHVTIETDDGPHTVRVSFLGAST